MMERIRGNTGLLVEIVLRGGLFSVFWYLESCPPFYRTIKHEELWLYQNPVHLHDTVPTVPMLILALAIPSAFIIIHYFSTGQYMDLRQALLTLYLVAGLTGVITNLIKLSVGRPRPDFFYRCFPDGKMTSDLQCVGDPDMIQEGRKSFPSGHSSWIFACFTFLSLYLLGKLQCLGAGGRGEGWRLCLALTPLMAATLVGLSRLQDCKHHWDDVLCGGVLGFLVACLCYHHHYPPTWCPGGHTPYPPQGFATGPVGSFLGGKAGKRPAEVGGAVSEDCELAISHNGNRLANRRL